MCSQRCPLRCSASCFSGQLLRNNRPACAGGSGGANICAGEKRDGDGRRVGLRAACGQLFGARSPKHNCAHKPPFKFKSKVRNLGPPRVASRRPVNACQPRLSLPNLIWRLQIGPPPAAKAAPFAATQRRAAAAAATASAATAAAAATAADDDTSGAAAHAKQRRRPDGALGRGAQLVGRPVESRGESDAGAAGAA